MPKAGRRISGFRFGPVLLFRGTQGDRWRVSVLFAIDGEDEPDDLTVGGVRLAVPPRHVAQWQGMHVWRFDFAVPRPDDGASVTYGFRDGEIWRFQPPPDDEALTLVHARDPGRNESRWRGLSDAAAVDPPHLLLLGGTTIGTGDVWTACSGLPAWAALPEARRRDAPFTPSLAREAFGFFVGRHVELWSRPDVAAIVSRIPMILMWGGRDADSRPPSGANGAVPRGVAAAARRAFSLFQLGTRLESPPECAWGAAAGGASQGFRLGSTGLLILDPAGEDSRPAALPGLLARLAGCRRLVVSLDVPAEEAPEHAERLARIAAATHANTRAIVLTGLPERMILRDGARVIALAGAGLAPASRNWLGRWLDDRRLRRLPSPLPGFAVERSPFADGRLRLSRPCWLSLTLAREGGTTLRWLGGPEPEEWLCGITRG